MLLLMLPAGWAGRVFVQNRRIGVPSYVMGVRLAMRVRAQAWVEPWDGEERREEKKRALEKLDSQFIIARSPDSPASLLSCVWCSGAHTRPVVADAYVGTLVSGPVARRTRG